MRGAFFKTEVEKGYVALLGSVLAEAEGPIEGERTGHVDDVGIQDDAVEGLGRGAGERFGYEFASEAQAAAGGCDEEALDLAGEAGGVAGVASVGDAGGGLRFDEGKQDFTVVVGVGDGQGASFFFVASEVEGSAGLGLAKEVAVEGEEVTGVGLEHVVCTGRDGCEGVHTRS